MMLEPLGEVGANFSLQLSSRTQFTKINNKKVIAENQCEKHKKSSLPLCIIEETFISRIKNFDAAISRYFATIRQAEATLWRMSLLS